MTPAAQCCKAFVTKQCQTKLQNMFLTGATDSVWSSIAPCELVTKCLGLTPIFTGVELKCWQSFVNQTHLLLTFAFMLRTYWNCLSKDLVYETGSQIFNESGNIIVIMFYLLPMCCVAFSRFVAGGIYRIVAMIDSVDCGVNMNCVKNILEMLKV